MHKTTLILILIIAAIASVTAEIWRRKRLNRYWQRLSIPIARKWKKQFPNATKGEIRDFLDSFINAFGFSRKKRLQFQPDDKVWEIYRVLYPKNCIDVDYLETETFAEILEENYRVQLEGVWNDDITLGQIFRLVNNRKS